MQYIEITLKLMGELNIRTRDTYDLNYNFDDKLTHGIENGPRLLKIEWVDTDKFTNVQGKKYDVPGRTSVAYDAYKILVPNRFKKSGRDDQIIHECVHFLQQNTNEDDKGYVYFKGHNYLEYVSQRQEIEAHLVQIVYIFQQCKNYLESLNINWQCIEKLIQQYKESPTEAFAIKIILLCKACSII